MPFIVSYLWLIPALPLAAAVVSTLAGGRQRALSAGLAIGTMFFSLLLSLCALTHALTFAAQRWVVNVEWFRFGQTAVQIGWVLDPLSAIMLTMVTFVGLLIFIYSIGYMARDERFARFFSYLSLFAAAMLGVVLANSLLLLFVCWELVGLASYLLIGFWFQKPAASAAAKKAFLTTRIGDVFFFLGMMWLFARTGTLLFVDAGKGCLEAAQLAPLGIETAGLGLTVAAAISLLIFCGAAGKSGQFPLHVWLPDAMEGPTPVSALIHAATMVAAGVYLIARIYPLVSLGTHSSLTVIAWVGAFTAFFAATIAIAQNDIKRILAYSTVSQLGFMMLGLAVGGVAVGIFHLITHAFFKALLFLGAGSVIHGCHEEQDIRKMGGLRKQMPVTFATYSIGMLALSGFPLVFSGFWSKDAILESAHTWPISQGPFLLASAAAVLTAFYMTRQMYYVFFGKSRVEHRHPHESPTVMTVPLVILALFAVVLGFAGTPVWTGFQSFIEMQSAPAADLAKLIEPAFLGTLLLSTIIVTVGLGLGWLLYGRNALQAATEPDVLEAAAPGIFRVLAGKYFLDELYDATVIRLHRLFAKLCAWLDDHFWSNLVAMVKWDVLTFAWFSRSFDVAVVNGGFDSSCDAVQAGGESTSHLQSGQEQRYLKWIGLALFLFLVWLFWGARG
jgi:NADH-quinone oxidoreductase subunit L